MAAWGPVILCEAVVLYLSSRPYLALPNLFHNIDKVAHFTEYAALGGLIYRALRWSGGSARSAAVLPFFLVAGLAAGDEWFQGFIPGRTKDVGDWAADCLGSLAGIGVMGRLENWLPAGWARPPREPGPKREMV